MHAREVIVSTWLSGIILISCASQPPTIPLPPKVVKQNGTIELPNPASTTQGYTAESAAAAESQPQRFKRFTEERGPGGAVNKVIVDNPGKIPDYYLTPEQPTSNSNTNPDKLSTPNWQWKW